MGSGIPYIKKGEYNIKVDKVQLANILGIKKDTLRKIENNNKLNIRLIEKGYILKSKIKEGRKVYYEIELKNENKKVYSDLLKNYYKTNKEREFTMYFGLRTLTNDMFPFNKADISNKTNVSTKTIAKWDNTLINKEIIAKDGYYYFSIDKMNNNKIEQCSKDEYNNFWRNKAYLKAFNDLQMKYIEGKITLTELQLASAEIGSVRAFTENKYYYRIKKYKTNEENKMYIDTFNLIKSIYGNDKEFKINYEIIDAKDVNFVHIIKFKKLNKNKYINIKVRKIMDI